MSTVLIVEDEKHLADGLRFNLEAEEYSVETMGDGEAALELLLKERKHYDAVVLDVMLPGKDGFEVVAELRAADLYVPVLMLTARGRPEDVLRGFEAGADDYLPKPFELKVLTARLNALLRRREWFDKDRVRDKPNRNLRETDLFEFDGRRIDFGKLTLHTPHHTIQLTVMEAGLLRYLIRNEGRAVSRKEMLEEVWGLREDTDTRAIDNFIVRLRKYLEEEPSRPKHLLTVRGLGYRFVAQSVEHM